MGQLIYWTNISLDGFIEDESGSFGWSEPDEEVHRFVNQRFAQIGTSLYGRRLYETMIFWEDPANVASEVDYVAEFGPIWRDSDKVVYSTTLEAVASERTRIEREFDPSAVRALKAEADNDVVVGGAELAAHALRAGLVDELHFYVVPVIVGGGKRALPPGWQSSLQLQEEHRFAAGWVFLRYTLNQLG